jgi:Tol biopolymer transport system component
MTTSACRPARRSFVVLACLLTAHGAFSTSADAAPHVRGGALRADLVSVSTTGVQGNRESFTPLVSADGRYVAFTSFASTLGDDPDADYSADIFLRDTVAGTTLRVTHSRYHSYAVDMSADGRFILFVSQIAPENGETNAFVYDRATGTTERVDVSSTEEPANGVASDLGAISDDGRFVAFTSNGSNLTVDEDRNGAAGDVFVRDRSAGTTTRISPNEPDGFCSRGKVSMNSDGRYVAFACYRPFSQPLFVFDQNTGLLQTLDDEGTDPSVSDDGRYVAFMSGRSVDPSDDNGYDVFVSDRATGTTVAVSTTPAGTAGDVTSQQPAISGDGRHVAFVSGADDLVDHDTVDSGDIFVRDLLTGQLVRVKVKTFGNGSGDYGGPALSRTGYTMAFMSGSDNLVKSDDNGALDIFEVRAAP